MADNDGMASPALPGRTVVGIPARNEAATIGHVAAVADEGLAALCPPGDSVIVLADNGSTDGTVERFLATAAGLRSRVAAVQSAVEGSGKGTNVFALIEKALELGAQRLVLLDGDVRSARPDWVCGLALASEGPEPRMVLPVYRRNRYEATSTNHLVRPLLAAAFGAYVQQPIGGDFAFNRAFLERIGGWRRPQSANLYGIDVWLTANALRRGLRLVEAPLGRKVHNSPFPKILYLPQQVLDALFHVVAEVAELHPAQPQERQSAAVDELAAPQDPELVARINRTVCAYLEVHGADVERLFPCARQLKPAPWGLRVTVDQWPLLLTDALAALAAGELERARDHLIALCVNRVMTFWTEIEGLTGAGVDELLHRQARETARAVSERAIVFTAPPARPGPLVQPAQPGPSAPPAQAAFGAGRWLEFQAPIAV